MSSKTSSRFRSSAAPMEAKREFLRYTRHCQKIRTSAKLSKVVAGILALGKSASILVDFQPVLQWLSPPVREDAINETLLEEKLTQFVLDLRSLACEPIFFLRPPKGSDKIDFTLLLPSFKDAYIDRLAIYSDYQRFRYTNDSINPLVSRHLLSVLHSLGVNVIQCINHQLVDVYRYHQRGGACGVLSNDPDFALLPECKFIDLAGFDLGHYLRASPRDRGGEGGGGEVMYFFTSLDIILQHLNLTPEQLVDAVLLSGNEYTSPLNSLYKMDSYIKIKSNINHKFEAICDFVRDFDSSPLFEFHKDLVHVMESVPCYKGAVERSVLLYLDTEEASLPEPDNTVAYWARKMISLNRVSSLIYTIVNSGIYWRPPLFESVAVGRVSVHDLLLPVRKALYKLLGAETVIEYGSTSEKTFGETQVRVKLETERREPEDVLQFIIDIGQLSVGEKLKFLFNTLVCKSMSIDKSESDQTLLADIEDDKTLLHYSLATLSLYLYGHYIRQFPGEIDGLIEFCLLHALGFDDSKNSEGSKRPNERALTVSVWFSHLLDTLYHFCDILCLTGYLPHPFTVFKTLRAVDVIESHLESSSPDFTDGSMTCSCPLSLLPSVKHLRSSVLAPMDGSSLTHNPISLVEVFVKALKDVKASGYKTCCNVGKRIEEKRRQNDKREDENAINCNHEDSIARGTQSPSPSLTCTGGEQHKASLSIHEHRDTILHTISTHSVTCIVGEAGCGKSSMVPQYIFDSVPTSNVIVAQPRCIATIGLAKRVASQRGVACGCVVGYCVSGRKAMSKETAITYCTAGYLLQKLSYHPLHVRKYSHIILDEVHERSIDADFILLLVRKLVHEIAPATKIILMSATMQGPLFVNYFKEVFKTVSEPVFVGARRCRVDEYFVDQLPRLLEATPTSKLSREQVFSGRAIRICSKDLSLNFGKNDSFVGSHASTSPPPLITSFMQTLCSDLVVFCARKGHSILIFLPGINEILDYHEILSIEFQKRGLEDAFAIFVLHSQVTIEEQYEVLTLPTLDKTHVILATNIAESSLTIPSLRVVINFGITKIPRYDHKQKMTCLVRSWCSKAACAQRSGRVGRVSEGIVVHLFPHSFYRHVLCDFNPAEMHTTPLGKLLLRARQLGEEIGISRPSELLKQTVEPPSLLQIEYALQELVSVGALVTDINFKLSEIADITIFGQFCLTLALDLDLSRLIFFGIFFGCPVEAIVIATSISISHDVFLMPSRVLIQSLETFKEALRENMASRFSYDNGRLSDALMVCSVFKDWSKYYYRKSSQEGWSLSKSINRFCVEKSLSYHRFSLFLTLISVTAEKVAEWVPDTLDFYEQILLLASMTRDGLRDEISFCDNDSVIQALLVASFVDNTLLGKQKTDSFRQPERKAARQARDVMAYIDARPNSSLVLSCSKHITQNILKSSIASVLPSADLEITLTAGMGVVEIQAPPPNMTKEQSLSLLWQFSERRPRWKLDSNDIGLSIPYSPFEFTWFRFNSTNDKVYNPIWRNRTSFVIDYSVSPPPFLGVATSITGGEVIDTCKGRGLTVLPSLRSSRVALVYLLAFQSFQSSIQLRTNDEGVTAFKINSVELDFKEWQSLSPDDLRLINALRNQLSLLLAITEVNEHLPLRNMKLIRRLVLDLTSLNYSPGHYGSSDIKSGAFKCELNHQPFYPKLKCSLLETEEERDGVKESEEGENRRKEKDGEGVTMTEVFQESIEVKEKGRQQGGDKKFSEANDTTRLNESKKVVTMTTNCSIEPVGGMMASTVKVINEGQGSGLGTCSVTNVLKIIPQEPAPGEARNPVRHHDNSIRLKGDRTSGATDSHMKVKGLAKESAREARSPGIIGKHCGINNSNGDEAASEATDTGMKNNEQQRLVMENTRNPSAGIIRKDYDDNSNRFISEGSEAAQKQSISMPPGECNLNPQAVSFIPAVHVHYSNSLFPRPQPLLPLPQIQTPVLPHPPPNLPLPVMGQSLPPPFPPGFTSEGIAKDLFSFPTIHSGACTVNSVIEREVLMILLRNGLQLPYHVLMREESLSKLLDMFKINLPIQFFVKRSHLFKVFKASKGGDFIIQIVCKGVK